MNLKDKEEKILVSDNQEVILTNIRISNEVKSFFKSSYITVFLEDISSVEKGFEFDFTFLKFAIYSIIAAVLFSVFQSFKIEELYLLLQFGLSLSVLFIVLSIILFFLSKRRYIIIESMGGKLLLMNLRKMSDKNIDEFVKVLLEAKLDRIDSIKQRL